jgi:hypothetical protein
MLAFDNLLETADSLLERHINAGAAGESLSHVEGL